MEIYGEKEKLMKERLDEQSCNYLLIIALANFIQDQSGWTELDVHHIESILLQSIDDKM